MSKYTTLLRWPIEQKLDALKLSNSEMNWPKVYGMLGLEDYPIFDELYRQTLNDKIIRAYYFREIGFETIGQFAWQMRRTMFEIMPYYNQLYDSEKLITDPLLTKNMDYSEKWTRDERIVNNDNGQREQTDTENMTRKSTTDTTSDSTTAGESRNVFQDTPMNGLDTGAIKNMDYATNVTFDNSTDTTKTVSSSTVSENRETTGKLDENTTSNRDETGDYDGTKTHNEKGFDTDQSELLLNYRKTFINIDLEIVDRLNVLFMGLW